MTAWQNIALTLLWRGGCLNPNVPEFEGFLAVLLIFPVVLIGARLAHRTTDPKTKMWQWLKGLALGIAVLMTVVGGAWGTLGITVIFLYGMLRGLQIMGRGRGWRSYMLGPIVLLWVIFASLDYCASTSWGLPNIWWNEDRAHKQIMLLAAAQDRYYTRPGPPQERSYATLAELRQVNFIELNYVGQEIMGYRMFEIVEPTRQKFLFYTLPAHTPHWPPSLPGASLFSSLGLQAGTGERSFGVDETGAIRSAVRTIVGPVTREEFMTWGW
jgi:hypothetical protein